MLQPGRARAGPPSKRPKVSTPVGHICTQAEQRTHSGSCIGRPLLAKLMMSIPWWQTDVQTLHEMHLDFSGEDPELREARVDVHQRGERAGEAAPHAAGEPEVHPHADDAGEEDVDDVVVVELEAERMTSRRECRWRTFPTRGPPRCWAQVQETMRASAMAQAAKSATWPTMLTRFQSGPCGIFCRCASPSVSASAPHEQIQPQYAPLPQLADDQRNDHERLQERDGQPPPHRLRGEDVPDEERPGQDEPERPPVLPSLAIVGGGEEVVGEGLAEPRVEGAVVAQQRQHEVREQEERDPLDQRSA